MSKKIMFILLTIALVGALFLGLSLILEQHTADPEPSSTPAASGSSHQETLLLDSFHNIELDACSPDITLEIGDSYAVRYHLHSREKLKIAEVKQDTLYFSTAHDHNWTPDKGNWKVIITIPAETAHALSRLHLSTVAGSVTLSGISCESLSAETVSGNISVADSTIQELSAENTSGSIELSGTFGTADAETVSGDIRLSGSFDEADAESVSGSCTLNGTLKQEASMETVSGNISVSVPAEAIEAESIGGILLNGEKQGRELHLPGAKPSLELESVSGRIEIETTADPI